jgi:hypothetical protein
VSYDGSIKLIDFGIAKANVRMTHTREGFIKGKAGYMAPEQVKGHPIDRRSDVFALGVLAYELATMVRAFHSESQFEQLHRIATATIAPPSHVTPRFPVELEDVIMRALEVDPDDRYQDAAAMRAELERVATRLGLALGEDTVIAVLDQLYGQRPEPWLVATGSIDYDVTPQVVDLPFAPPRQRATTHGIMRGAATAELAGVATEPVELAEMLVEEQPHEQTQLPAPPPARFATGILAARKQRRSLALAVVGCAVLGIAATTLASYLFIDSEPAAAPSAPVVKALPLPPKPKPPKPPPPQKTVAATPIVEPPPPDHVVLDVITDPPEATVVLDGVRLGHTPYHADVPIKKSAWLKVRRFDRLPVKIKVQLDHDYEWKVTLPPRRQ